MKIAIGTNIKDGPWGGGNAFARNLSSFLIESGHEVVYSLVDKDIDIILLTEPRKLSETSSLPPYLLLVHKLTKLGGKTVNIDPLNSSILLFVMLINASSPELYSSNDFTSGGNELILGCTLRSGKKTLLTVLANLSLISLNA